MTRSTAFLSPNGQVRTVGTGPATRLQVATVEGMATLEREAPGAAWALAAQSLTHRHLSSLLFEPLSGKLFAGAHEDGGLWVSDDGEGKSWRQLTNGLDRPHIYALAATRSGDRATLFAGSDPAGLYRSADLGESWSEMKGIFAVPDADKWTFPVPPHIAHVKSLATHPAEPETLFVMVEQGALLKSADNGDSFVEIASYSRPDDLAYRDMHRLLINPADPAEMYLATGEGLYRSTDAGGNWDHLMRPGDRIGYPDHLFFDPSDGRTVYMAGTTTDPGGWFQYGKTEPVISRSDDAGKTWTELQGALPGQPEVSLEAMCQHVWSGGHTLAVASAAGDVWTSDDGGSSWIAAPRVAPVSKDHHHLPFLSEEDKGKWLARRHQDAGTYD